MATLAQYVSVVAARAEGIPLDEAASAEGFSAKAWAKIDLGWKQKLTSDEALAVAYEEEMGRAEERWHRRVRPLDEDVGAWVSWLDAYGRSTAPLALLQQYGLRMSDLSRLARGWSQKLSADPALRERMAEVWKEGPGPLPPIVVDVRERPIGPLPGRTNVSTRAEGPAPDETVMEAALVLAELDVFPAREEEVWSRHGLVEAGARAKWRARWLGAAAPEVARDLRALRAHFAEQFRLGRTEQQQGSDGRRGSGAQTMPPFSKATQPDATTASAPTSAGDAMLPDAVREGSIRNETGELHPFVRAQPALPFEARPAPFPAFVAAIEADRRRRATSPRPAALNETAALPHPRARPAKARTAVLALPELSLEQYASLRAELGMASTDTAAILAKYGIDGDAAMKAMDLYFAGQMHDDPTLLARFAQAVRRYQEWLKAQGGTR